MRRKSPRCFCARRSTRTACLLHSWAMMPQQRSAADFSRLGDSAITNRRRAASMSGKRGFKKRRNSLGERESGMVRRCYQRDATRAILQSGAQEEVLAICPFVLVHCQRLLTLSEERVSRRAELRI